MTKEEFDKLSPEEKAKYYARVGVGAAKAFGSVYPAVYDGIKEGIKGKSFSHGIGAGVDSYVNRVKSIGDYIDEAQGK